MEDAATEIARRELSGPITDMIRIEQGDQNAVFRFATAQGPFVIRMRRSGEATTYPKEQWAMGQAAAAGVAVPKVLALGSHGGNQDYMLMEWIEGTVGTAYAGDMPALYAQLGHYASRLATVRVEGYGWNMAMTPQPRFTRSWAEAVDADMAYILDDRATLVSLGVLDDVQSRRIRAFMREYRAWDLPACLSHNDICLDNLVIANDGTVHMIDWSNACAQPAPFFEIARVGSNVSPELRAAFVTGYGLSDAEWRGMETTVQKLQLIHCLRAVVWAASDAPAYRGGFTATARTLLAAWPDD